MVEYVIKKPFGIAVLMAVLGFIGVLGSFASIGLLVASLFGDGPYNVNGAEVSKAEFLRFLIPFTAIYFPMCLIAFAAAWSIHSEHPRSRPLLLCYFTAPLLLAPLLLWMGYPLSEASSMSLPLLVVPGLAWIYLYRKRTVLEYYGALRRRVN
jgi:hypothetical protein